MQSHEVVLSEVRAGAGLRTKCSERGRPPGAPGKRVPTRTRRARLHVFAAASAIRQSVMVTLPGVHRLCALNGAPANSGTVPAQQP